MGKWFSEVYDKSGWSNVHHNKWQCLNRHIRQSPPLIIRHIDLLTTSSKTRLITVVLCTRCCCIHHCPPPGLHASATFLAAAVGRVIVNNKRSANGRNLSRAPLFLSVFHDDASPTCELLAPNPIRVGRSSIIHDNNFIGLRRFDEFSCVKLFFHGRAVL
ncbi:hypothetical protein ACI65C_003275 [Semiaphis heraclei]